MARCRIGMNKVSKLKRITGIDNILSAAVRGNTDHRIDLLLEDGSIISLSRKYKILTKSSFTWDAEKFKKERKC